MESRNSKDCWYYSVCSIANDDCIKHCLRYDEMLYLMNNSGIPKARQIPLVLIPENIDLDSFRRLKEIKTNIVDFVNKGNNLSIISSITGNGKTSWAIKLMLKYFDSIWAGNGFRTRGLFVHVPTLLLQLKDFNNPVSKEYKDKLLNADLIIWDDVVVTGMSQYDYNNLLSLLDQRILNNKSNIYTINYNHEKDDLQKIIGARIASRILSSEQVVLKGLDRR